MPLPAVPEPQTVCALPNRVLVRINDGIATLTGQQCPNPIVVNVQVFTAQNFNFTALANLSLSYQWRSTDGSIVNQNSSSTTWQLPGGPGLHFAYVLVSNQFGGYREGRFFVNTDAFGNPPDVPMATLHFPTMRVAQPNMGLTAKPPTIPGIAGLAHGAVMPAPPPSRQSAYVFPPGIGPAIAQTSLPTLAAPPNANPFLYAVRGFDLPPGSQVYLADGNGNRFPPQGAVATDARGQWIIRFPPLANELLFNGTYNYGSITPPPTNSLVGYCASPNGSTQAQSTFSVCVTPQFGVIPFAGVPIPPFYLTSNYGNGVAGWQAAQLADGSPCGMTNLFFGVANSGICPIATAAGVLGPSAPVIVNMTGSINGNPIANGLSGLLAPKATGIPSDNLPGAENFLAARGLDTPLSACRYYMAIGAAGGCNLQGNLTSSVTFDQWKRAVLIGEYAPPGAPPTYQAVFVNHADLNLTRFHSSISYGPNQTAAVVCNSLGPTSDQPGDINNAINSSFYGGNLVACVAMDYMVSPGVNGNQPFTRFYIFGPDGQLLPSINLDNRREKYVPGACVACHGGDFYAGKFPEDGTGQPNIGSHFLPYDTGNFSFSTLTGFTEFDQQQAIYQLNQNVLNAGPNISIKSLVAGWYKNGTALDKFYVPDSWKAWSSPASTAPTDFYVNVVARSCRGCHVALTDPMSFECVPMGCSSLHLSNSATQDFQDLCGDHPMGLSGRMPNSKVAFDRFFAPGSNQPAFMGAWVNFLWKTLNGINSAARGCPPPSAGSNPGN
ncbi:MAG: hypothetical protein WA642_07495 [Steroidobacteraceae bacterium]